MARRVFNLYLKNQINFPLIAVKKTVSMPIDTAFSERLSIKFKINTFIFLIISYFIVTIELTPKRASM